MVIRDIAPSAARDWRETTDDLLAQPYRMIPRHEFLSSMAVQRARYAS